MLTNKRIVIVHPGNPKFDYRLKKTAESLTSAGAEVIVVGYLSCAANDIQDWNCTTGCRPRPYTMVKASNNRIWILRVLWNLSVVRLQSFLERKVGECEGLYKIAQKYKPDLLYFIGIESIEEAREALKTAKETPVVYEAYEYYPSLLRDDLYFSDSRRNAKLRKVEKEVCSSPYVTTIVVGEDIAQGYQKQYGCVPPKVIHNVAPYSLGELPEHCGPVTFYFQSYLRPTYNIENLIDAFLKVKGDAKLVIQGDAHEENYFDSLKKYISDRNGDSKIELKAACAYEDIVNIASQYDVGLITISAVSSGKINESIVYALQNKLFTYMSAGLAIIAADYPAQANIIRKKGNGLLFEPDDYANLTVAMQKIVDHPEKVKTMREASLIMSRDFAFDKEMKALTMICMQAIGNSKKEK